MIIKDFLVKKYPSFLILQFYFQTRFDFQTLKMQKRIREKDF